MLNNRAEVDACSETFPRGDIQSGKLSQQPRLANVRSLRSESVVGRTEYNLDMRIDRYHSHLPMVSFFETISFTSNSNSNI